MLLDGMEEASRGGSRNYFRLVKMSRSDIRHASGERGTVGAGHQQLGVWGFGGCKPPSGAGAESPEKFQIWACQRLYLTLLETKSTSFPIFFRKCFLKYPAEKGNLVSHRTFHQV